MGNIGTNNPDPCRQAIGDQVAIPGYGNAGLPFATEPGAFLGEALKALHGVLHHYRCAVARAEFDFTPMQGAREEIALDGGLAYTVGGGTTDHDRGTAGVAITPVAFSQHGRGRTSGDVTIEHDATRPVAAGRIRPEKPEQVFDAFRIFTSEANSLYFLTKYHEEPLAIYRKYISHFAPLRLDIEVNARIQASRFPGLVLINRAPIRLESSALPDLAQDGAQWHATGPIELVDAKNPGGPTLAVIRTYPATATFRKDLSSPAFVPAAP